MVCPVIGQAFDFVEWYTRESKTFLDIKKHLTIAYGRASPQGEAFGLFRQINFFLIVKRNVLILVIVLVGYFEGCVGVAGNYRTATL